MKQDDTLKGPSRRALLRGLGVGAAALAFPHVWIPRPAYAQTSVRGAVRHLIYIRLSGGFRFTTAFNAEVDGRYNPFGASGQKAPGTQWGAGSLLERAPWLNGQPGQALRNLGMRRVIEFTNEMMLLPCVDHEPFSARADGNHGTALERFLTGYVGGATSFFTMLNFGLRNRVVPPGQVLLPAFSLGEAGMALGQGTYAAYRPPVLDGEGFRRLAFDAGSSLPPWASRMASRLDEGMRQRLHPELQVRVEAYRQSREATRAYGEIFSDPLLQVANRSPQVVDGISNQELETMLGTDGAARRVALALRLFHFGCPAVYLNQGWYDFHSAEEANLPSEMEGANRLLSALNAALKRMQHPEGGTYWDKTLVVVGSEFGRTAGNERFNSARGSDHSSDLSTRWMSMPIMGGLVQATSKGGKSLGSTRPSDLRAEGPVYSYRSLLKTLMDLLGADHSEFFPADRPLELFA